MSESLLRFIVGLGNPGKDYEYTRHNLGFLAVARLAKEQGLKFVRNSACQGFLAEDDIDGVRAALLLPLTFVNHSGVAVREIVKRKKILPENILVVCDDLNIDFGQLRLRPEGSDGGHNGLTSVITHLRTRQFPRLRMGIGRPRGKEDVVDFVLSGFYKEERPLLDAFIDEAVSCCMIWLKEGTTKAMSRFNSKRKENG